MLTLEFDDHPWTSDGSARVSTDWRDEDDQPFAVGWTDRQARWITWNGLGTFVFRDNSASVRFHPEPQVNRDHAAGFFARVVQPLILQAQGAPALHGSAVANAQGSIVFCGVSGNGKSTLAFALANTPGFSQVADDAVVLSPRTSDDFAVMALPFRPRLRPSASSHFGTRNTPAQDTAGIAMDEARATLRAVVLLEQRDDAPTEPPVVRVSASRAFTRLLTHAHCFDQADRPGMRVMVQHYLTLADRVPVFDLTYRADFERLPRLAAAVIDAAMPHKTHHAE